MRFPGRLPGRNVPPVKEYRYDDERNVDGREIPGEPLREIDVSDRPVAVSELSCHGGKRAVETVAGEDEDFRGDHRGRDPYPPVSPLPDAGVENIKHASLDGEPRECVKGLHRSKQPAAFIHASLSCSLSGKRGLIPSFRSMGVQNAKAHGADAEKVIQSLRRGECRRSKIVIMASPKAVGCGLDAIAS